MAGGELQIYQIGTTDANIDAADWFPRDRDSDKVTVNFTASDLDTYIRSNFTPLNAEYITLDPAPGTPAYTEGRLYWDSTHKTLAIQVGADDVTLQTGQELMFRARNNTGVTITNGQVVYISGVIGQTVTIALSKADADATALVAGVATHNIENNTVGFITVQGELHNLNTTAFMEGDTLYLSAATAGAFTATPPAKPNYVIKIGKVLRSHVTMGEIYIDVDVAPNSTTSFHSIRVHDTIEVDTLDTVSSTYIQNLQDFVIDGSLSINTTSKTLHINGADQTVYQLTAADDSATQDAKVGYGDAASIFGNIDLCKARGTEAAPTAVVNADPLGAVRFRGYNTSFWGAGYLACSVDGTPTATYVPGKMQFNLTNNSGQFIDVLGLYHNGGMAVNSTARSFNFGSIKNIFVKEDTDRLMCFAAYGAGATPETNFMLARGTQASPTTIVANDFPGIQRYWGYDGTNFILCGETYYKAVSVSAGLVAADYAIVTRNTSGVEDERLYITANGNVGIGPGNVTPADLVHIKDNVTAGTGVRNRIENTAVTGSLNTGTILKNTQLELFQGISYTGSNSHWTIYSNTSGFNLMTYDVVNDGLVVGAFSSSGHLALFNVNSSNQKVKYLTEYADSSTNAFVGKNHGNGNPVQLAGAVSNGSIATPAIVVNNQTSLQLTGFGYDGATYRAMGTMQFQVDGTPGSADMPGKWILSTTSDGGTVPVEVMRADATQAIAIGKGSNAHASALVELTSTTRGFLPPRMTTAQRDAIATPGAGLMIFNTTTSQWEGYNGTAWVILG